MSITKKNILYYLKKYHAWYFLLIALLYLGKLLSYNASSLINTNYHVISMKIDSLIPFCKYFILFYTTYYWFPILQLYLMSYADKRKFYRILIAIAISCLISNIIFLIYQVKMVRPEITENTIFDNLINLIYNIDGEALNCFPSIHAVMGCSMIIGGYNTKKFPAWLKITSVILGCGCILSTVFVKQHYFIDMIVGTILMLIVYFLVLLIDKRLVKKQSLSKIN